MHQYQKIRTIGKGASAIVWLARHNESKELVAIKQIRLEEYKKIKPFETEILKRISHPNIIKFYEAFEDGVNIYIVLEYCEVGDLEQFMLLAGKPFPEDVARGIIYFIGKALVCLNQSNVCHRDIKPSNIFFSSSFQVRVADFGFARMDVDDELVMESYCGTPLYMGPELFEGKTEYNRSVDVWSLGVILYHMVFGEHPFWKQGESRNSLYKKVSSREFSLPKDLACSQECRDLITKCLSYEKSRMMAAEFVQHSYFKPVKANEKQFESIVEKFLRGLKEPVIENINKEIAYALKEGVGLYMRSSFSNGNLSELARVNLPCLSTLYRQTSLYCLNTLPPLSLSFNGEKKSIKIPMSLFPVETYNNLADSLPTDSQNNLECTKASLQLMKKILDPSFDSSKSGAVIVRLLTIMIESPASLILNMDLPARVSLQSIDPKLIKKHLQSSMEQMPCSLKVELLFQTNSDLLIVKRMETIRSLLTRIIKKQNPNYHQMR